MGEHPRALGNAWLICDNPGVPEAALLPSPTDPSTSRPRPMAKFLLLIGVIVAVVLLVRNFQRSLARQNEKTAEPPAPAKSEDMVRCDRCGVHLPKSESFLSQGRFYCSDDHRRLGTPGADR
jgi:uncharacterized protein